MRMNRPGIFACLIASSLAVFIMGCGPGDRLPPVNPPLQPDEDISAWKPLALPTVDRPVSPAEIGLLGEEPCGPPCWQGLIPGMTSVQEVRAFLERSPFVASWHEEPATVQGSIAYLWGWDSPEPAAVPNKLLVRDDLLVQISLLPQAPISLDTVIEQLGEPDWVDVQAPALLGVLTWSMDLYYPGQGLRVLIDGLEAVEGEICPLTQIANVRSVTYMPPGSIEEMLTRVYLSPSDRQEAMARVVEWDGAACLPALE